MKLGQLIIHSDNIEASAQFISELLDLSVIPSSKGIRVVGDDINMVFVQRPSFTQGMVFESITCDFQVEKFQDLDAIVQKYQFIAYKHGKEFDSLPEIHGNEKVNYLMIEDPEGRKWKFTYISS